MPFAVFITTSCTPNKPDGVVTVIEVAVSLVIVAATPPIVTEVALARLAPVMVTAVPPAVEPELGKSEVIFGDGFV